MDHLEEFRGTYEINKQRLERQRDLIFKAAEQFIIGHHEPILGSEVDGMVDYPLDWVSVQDPNNGLQGQTMEVLPVLYIENKDGNAEKAGLYAIELNGILPDGEQTTIGRIFKGCAVGGSGIILKNIGTIDWVCADTEIFLNLLESSIEANHLK